MVHTEGSLLISKGLRVHIMNGVWFDTFMK
jgi:hypothetical protein